MRPNLDPPPPPKEDKVLVSSRAGYAFANLEGFLCSIRKFVLEFFGVSGGVEVTAPARKAKVSFFDQCSKMKIITRKQFIIKTCFIEFFWFFRFQRHFF